MSQRRETLQCRLRCAYFQRSPSQFISLLNHSSTSDNVALSEYLRSHFNDVMLKEAQWYEKKVADQIIFLL